ncbi:MAG: response regulator [Thiohalocapsa sp.]|uniref:response regulator n=1 Tax=Thiohalocapsa sp. TaxID=2497641 RepID=UPI0025E09718|nr:response regulator [Thiohalocapsa sp.]MCG6939621.1 response regulator [Thiohalocapsa sp.]
MNHDHDGPTAVAPPPEQGGQPLEPELRTLADHIPDIIGRVDRQLRYVFINRAVADLTAKPVAAHLGQTDEELGYPPALCRLWRGQYQEVFATARPSEIRYAVELPQGLTQFSKRAVPELAEDGSVESVAFIARDMTALERAAAERVSHRRLLAGVNRIFETLVTGVGDAAFAAACRAEAEALTNSHLSWLCELGADGVLREVAAETASGTQGHVALDAATLADPSLADGLSDQVLDQGLTLLAEGVRVPRPDPGGGVPHEMAQTNLMGVPLKHRDQVIGMIAVADHAGGYGSVEQDNLEALAPAIAEALALRKAEAAVEAAKQQAEVDRKRLEAVLEATPLAVALIDAETRRVIYQNRRTLALYGIEQGGFHLEAYAGELHARHPDGSPYALEDWPVSRCLGSGEVVHREEMFIQRAGGAAFPALVSAVPVCDARGKVVAAVVVCDDISEHKAAEAALAQLNQALEARVAEVSRQADQLRALASQLSRVEQRERQRLAKILHDHIQQLIVAAQMQSAAVVRDATSERQRVAGRAVQEVLAEALEVSRSLTVELSPPVLREAGLIAALDWLAERMQEQHGFTVQLHAETRAEPDAEELRYLLFESARELLLNAVKHAGVSSADVVLVRPRDGGLELSVSDDGVGFDARLLSRRRANATGFGLFSIQERLAHLGGRMLIHSAPGEGVQVTLHVPPRGEEALRRQAPIGADVVQAGAPQPRSAPSVHRVLLVDDHQIMRQGLAVLLQEEADIEVIGEAADGKHAVALAAELRPDVVIMDVNLGAGIDGVEATRRMLARDPSLCVIGLSMHVDSAVAAAMRDAGAVAYLTKGGPGAELIDAIRACHGN